MRSFENFGIVSSFKLQQYGNFQFKTIRKIRGHHLTLSLWKINPACLTGECSLKWKKRQFLHLGYSQFELQLGPGRFHQYWLPSELGEWWSPIRLLPRCRFSIYYWLLQYCLLFTYVSVRSYAKSNMSISSSLGFSGSLS